METLLNPEMYTALHEMQVLTSGYLHIVSNTTKVCDPVRQTYILNRTDPRVLYKSKFTMWLEF